MTSAPGHVLTGAPDDFDPLLRLVGDAQFVLLGEASHGTHELYRNSGLPAGLPRRERAQR